MPLAFLFYEQFIHLTQIPLRPNTQPLRNRQHAYQSFLSNGKNLQNKFMGDTMSTNGAWSITN